MERDAEAATSWPVYVAERGARCVGGEGLLGTSGKCVLCQLPMMFAGFSSVFVTLATSELSVKFHTKSVEL